MTTLYLFDVDGTLIRSFLREGAPRADYDLVEVLPGRRARLAALREAGASIALITNQAGVAMGYQTEEQVTRKLWRVVDALGLGDPGGLGSMRFKRPGPGDHRTPSGVVAYASLGHPKAKLPRWLDESDWRKPGGGMLIQAMADHGATPERTLYVGDMSSDRDAAASAGVPFRTAREFFAG